MEEQKDLESKEFEADIVSIILAVILPPLGVLYKEGANKQLVINLVLTLFGWVPGILHALYIILRSKS